LPQMEAKLQVKIELTDKKITLGNLATAIKSQRIEACILEVIAKIMRSANLTYIKCETMIMSV